MKMYRQLKLVFAFFVLQQKVDMALQSFHTAWLLSVSSVSYSCFNPSWVETLTFEFACVDFT